MSRRKKNKNSYNKKAILIGTHIPGKDRFSPIDSLIELSELCRTAKIEVVDTILQIRERLNPRYLIGQGKLDEIKLKIQETHIDYVIFDIDPSPAQLRNLEDYLECQVMGRTNLVLNIFLDRARSKVSKLQAEYARLLYELTTLRGRYSDMSSPGFRGPGEQKIEVKKQIIKHRLHTLRKQLTRIKRQFLTQRKLRNKEFIVTMVGYTNSGKSTLLNTLAKTNTLADDMLFATLDPIVRRVYVDPQQYFLLVDTIGFIRKLPYKYLSNFFSTIEEIRLADILIHVVDISQPDFQHKIEIVNRVLMEILDKPKETIIVFNKMDLLPPEDQLSTERILRGKYPNSVFISALNKAGIDNLIEMIEMQMKQREKNPMANLPREESHANHYSDSLLYSPQPRTD